jgi:copper chaperone CopZ
MARQRLHVELDGLVAVHAVRAVRTALAGVPGVEHADVSMRGAVLEGPGPIDEGLLADALALVGVRIVAVRAERAGLPLASDDEPGAA